MHGFSPSSSIPYINIMRGISTRENYFIPLNDNHIFDLRFKFPLNFFNGTNANKGKAVEFDEMKFKKNFRLYS